MTNQEAIEILTEMRDWNDYITQSDALQMAIDELEKKPAANSEDAISRQDAIDAVEKTKSAMASDGEIYVAKINAEMNIQKLPSVSTEKTGWWEKAKSEIRCGENKAYNADFTMGCEYAISVIERIFEEVEE